MGWLPARNEKRMRIRLDKRSRLWQNLPTFDCEEIE
ncbi:MAG: hypothetical protein FD146_946 [Anaerolineaceae bacterium]|nr:MAG: hypothetical protein FD146_946 [Anaerolineaceae bacterium]